MRDKGNLILFGIALVAALCIGLLYGFNKINTSEALEIAVLTTLVIVTMWYAKSTRKMAKEMEEQRLMASRPIIIQKAVGKGLETDPEWLRSDYFSHFVAFNAGNGPAIEVELILLNEERDPIVSERVTFLRANEQKAFFHFDLINREESTYYIVCQYQGVFPRIGEKTWQQTWLPFELIKASREGGIYVKPGELEFKFEVLDKDRIDAFASRSKPE